MSVKKCCFIRSRKSAESGKQNLSTKATHENTVDVLDDEDDNNDNSITNGSDDDSEEDIKLVTEKFLLHKTNKRPSDVHTLINNTFEQHMANKSNLNSNIDVQVTDFKQAIVDLTSKIGKFNSIIENLNK